MKNTVKFNNQTVGYVFSGWRDDDEVFLFDFGDSELVDRDGDDYYVHLEYHSEENRWVEEIWWEDEYLSFGEWTGANNQLRHDLDEIEEMLKKTLAMSENTISTKEVVDTLRSLEYGYSGYSIKDDRLEGAYIFVSELTGLSADALNEMINNVSIDPAP